MRPFLKKAFNLMGDNVKELSTKNDALKNKVGSYDQQWFEKPQANLLKQIVDEQKANLLMSRMKKQMEKHYINCLYIL